MYLYIDLRSCEIYQIEKRDVSWKFFSSVKPLSLVQLFTTPWTRACQVSLSITKTPKACSNSCPSSQWCHPTISSSVIPFSSHPQSASGSFPVSQFFTPGGQSIGASASASLLPINIQDWFPLGLTGLDILAVQATLKESFPTPQFKSINSVVLSLLSGPTLTCTHDYWKDHTFDYTELCWQSNVSVF